MRKGQSHFFFFFFCCWDWSQEGIPPHFLEICLPESLKNGQGWVFSISHSFFNKPSSPLCFYSFRCISLLPISQQTIFFISSVFILTLIYSFILPPYFWKDCGVCFFCYFSWLKNKSAALFFCLTDEEESVIYNGIKQCPQCGETKPFTEFYKKP